MQKSNKSLYISYPILFLPVAIAAIEVVPVPINGSNTVSPCKEYMFINLYGISKGKAALLARLSVLSIFCFVPLILSHTSENHMFLSSQKKELSLRFSFASGVLNSLLSPFLNINIHSCSNVTYAPAGNIPEPINLFGALVCFLHIMLGKLTKPLEMKYERMRA